MLVNQNRQIVPEGIALIKNSEGEGGKPRLKSYLDTGGIPTIGWGHTGKEIRFGMEIDETKALDYLCRDIEVAALAIKNIVKKEINDNQFSALVDFVFNLGSGALMVSTLLKKLNEGDFHGAADEFPRWNKSRVARRDSHGNIVTEMVALPGLTIRRAAERALFLKVA